MQPLRIGRNLRFSSPLIFFFLFNFSYIVKSPGDFFVTFFEKITDSHVVAKNDAERSPVPFADFTAVVTACGTTA